MVTQHLRPALLRNVAWLSSGPIHLQYTWIKNVSKKKFIDKLFLMNEVCQQRKVAPEATTFGWVWQVKYLIQSDCRILSSSIFLGRINCYPSFVLSSQSSGEVSIQEYHFCLGGASFFSHPIKLKGSLMSNSTGNKESISIIFCMEINIKGRKHFLGVTRCAPCSIRMQGSFLMN